MTKLTHKAAGIYAIAPTPFHPDGRIDGGSIDRPTDFYHDAGCTGITVLGVIGEAPKLEGAEALDSRDPLHRRAAVLRVIVGVSAPVLRVRSLARRSMDREAPA